MVNNNTRYDYIISSLARFPFTYFLFRKIGNYYFRKSKGSFLFWLDFITRQLERAYQRKRPVVWASIFTPSELLYALELIPIYPEMISASVASLGLAGYFIDAAESHFYMPDLCSFYRVASGMSLKKVLPRPDIVISTSLLCDGSVKFFQNISRYYGCKYFLIDIPYQRKEEAQKFLANQLRNLVRQIAQNTGMRFCLDKLRKSLELANYTALQISKINQLRENIPAPLSGWDALAYQLYMFFSSLGSPAGLNFYQLLTGEVENNVSLEKGAIVDEKIRILWLHQLRPYYPTIIRETLQGHKAVIACEEINQVYWQRHNLSYPFLSLAHKILANPGAGPLTNRIASIQNMIERYRIDGVIHFNQRGCRQSCGGAPVIKDYLRTKKVPMLILDGDGVDRRNYSEGQARTRLEAFLEMLDQKY